MLACPQTNPRSIEQATPSRKTGHPRRQTATSSQITPARPSRVHHRGQNGGSRLGRGASADRCASAARCRFSTYVPHADVMVEIEPAVSTGGRREGWLPPQQMRPAKGDHRCDSRSSSRWRFHDWCRCRRQRCRAARTTRARVARFDACPYRSSTGRTIEGRNSSSQCCESVCDAPGSRISACSLSIARRHCASSAGAGPA